MWLRTAMCCFSSSACKEWLGAELTKPNSVRCLPQGLLMKACIKMQHLDPEGKGQPGDLPKANSLDERRTALRD